jgi:photosynthetic reaction center cytochrome c subunit
MSALRMRTVAVLAAAVGLTACDLGPKEAVQIGYRGTGMEQPYDMNRVEAKFAQVAIPEVLPPAGISPPGPLPWQNVQVLNDISVAEFNRTMIAMST